MSIRGVDLFAGWGGLTEGATVAGLDVVWAGNHWPAAVATHALNHPTVVHVCQDLRQADWSALPDFEVLLAAPNCQPYSNASQPNRRAHHNAMRATAWAVIDCAEITRPKTIVVENVPQFRNWVLYPLWREALERLGYTVDERVVTASHHGVAQRRHRLFVVATQGRSVRSLVASDVEPAFGPLIDPTVSDDAWKLVARSTVGVKGRVERGKVRHGDRFLIQQVTGHSGISLDEPIRTITTASCHWNLVDGDRYRALTNRELARGMGFPDSFVWDESLPSADVTKGIGNAVCPPVAAAVCEAVLDALG